MAKVTTLPQMWWPLMGRPSVTLPYCPVCGRAWPLEQHHPVRRGAGKLFDESGWGWCLEFGYWTEPEYTDECGSFDGEPPEMEDNPAWDAMREEGNER